MSDDDLKEAREAFELAQDAESDNRLSALEDIRFGKLLEHWTDAERKAREEDGRPCLTIDKLGPVIRQVVNDARQNTPSIVVHPVDSGSDPETAEVFNGLIRNIEQSSEADVAYDTAFEFAVTGGFGYFRINTRYCDEESFDQELAIERIANPFSVYRDPYSTAVDSSDWNTAFVTDAMAKEAFEARWKGADAVDWEADAYGQMKAPWLDGENVLVAEYWRREEVSRQLLLLSDGQIVEDKAYQANKALFDQMGVTVEGRPRTVKSHKVTQTIMTGAEVLETVDWAGKYIPIVPVYGDDLFLEGKRHLSGIVKAARDPQRNFNYWRTTETEMLALQPKAPFIGVKGQFKSDGARWATANVDSHAYLEYDVVAGAPGPPQRQPFAGMPAGAIQAALNAADDIKSITGLHDASLGARSNETSGRAIMARQREGDVSTFHYVDNLSRAIRHAGRILIDLIPKVYAAPRVVRILGPDRKPQMAPVNQPFVQEVHDDAGRVQRVQKIFDLTAGKYDLIVKAGPSFTSRREEAANQMIELIRAYPAAAPVMGDLLAENLDWPGADEIGERLKALLPPQLQGQNPAVEEAKQAIAAMQQQLQALQAENAALKQDQANTAEELKIKAFEAETDRMKAAAEARARQIQAVVSGQPESFAA